MRVLSLKPLEWLFGRNSASNPRIFVISYQHRVLLQFGCHLALIPYKHSRRNAGLNGFLSTTCIRKARNRLNIRDQHRNREKRPAVPSIWVDIYPKGNEGCSLFSKCCFCIPLKTGCFILGYISMILNFVITLFFVGTLSFLAFYTHGFRYIRLKQNEDGVLVPDPDSMDRSRLSVTVTILVLVACLNIGWFLMNIVLLIGLHRKRPGHIKLHVTVATIRLVLSVIGVVLYGPHHTSHSMVVCCGEIALTAYFILVYYLYALQLEQNARASEPREVSDIVADVLFSYPQNIDKINLTEKNDKSFIA